MNEKTVHEPEEELLSAEDAYQDYLTLREMEEFQRLNILLKKKLLGRLAEEEYNELAHLLESQRSSLLKAKAAYAAK